MSGTIDLGGGGPAGGAPKPVAINLQPVQPQAPTASYPAYGETDAQAGNEPMLGAQARRLTSLAGSAVRRGLVEVQAYVEQFPESVRIFSFIVGVCYVIYNFYVFFEQILFGVTHNLASIFYNMIFGGVICCIEGKEEWSFRFGMYQKTIFQECAFLMGYRGRGIFYLYLSVLNMGEATSDGFFSGVASLQFVLGLALLMRSAAGFGLTPKTPPEAPSEVSMQAV